MSGTMLWNVDTQVDFIEPAGKLYFPGAEEARPTMSGSSSRGASRATATPSRSCT